MIAMKLLKEAIAFTKDERLKQELQVRTVVADSAFFCQRNEITRVAKKKCMANLILTIKNHRGLLPI